MTRPISLVLLFSLSAGVGCGGGGGSPDAGAGNDAGETPDGGTPVPLREQAGGTPSVIELADGYAYVAIGPRMTIWDLSNPAAPALAGQTEPLAGNVTAIAVAGGRAYVAQRVDLDGDVRVFDVSNPAAPVPGAIFRTVEEGMYTWPSGLAVAGERLFVADREQGVFYFDLADPDAPAPLGSIAGAFASSVRVVGDRLYLVDQGFIGTSISARDLGDLSDLGSTPANGALGFTSTDLAVGAGAGVQVLDVSDIANATEVFRYDELFTRGVAVTDQHAYVPAEDGLHVLDLSVSTAITRAGPFDLPTADTNAAAIAGDLLAVITNHGQLLAVDVATPTAPVNRALTDISLCADCISAQVAGDTLFIADFSGGLRTASLRDLGMLGRGPLPGQQIAFEDVAVAGDVAFVADWSFGLRVYDVSDPTAPAVLAALPTAGYPSSVALNGDRLYLGESTNGGALRVIDVSDPAQPTELGAIATSKARAVRARGNLAFVADEALDMSGGLRIFDTTNPSAIMLVGYYDGCANALDVALTGDLAILACSGDGFHIVDISDPAAPVYQSTYPAPNPGAAWSAAADGTRAYLGHDFGVTVVDLTDPTQPDMVTEKLTAWTVRRITVPASGHVLATAGLGGVYQWELP